MAKKARKVSTSKVTETTSLTRKISISQKIKTTTSSKKSILPEEQVKIPKSRILYNRDDVVVEIYKITCSVSSKCYIGQTVSHIRNGDVYIRGGMHNRLRQHFSEARSNRCNQSTYLNRAIRKYGQDTFKVELIAVCKRDDSNQMEKEYIKKYNTLTPNGYNLNKGGGGAPLRPSTTMHQPSSNKGRKVPKEIVDKYAESLRKYYDDLKSKKHKDLKLPIDRDPESFIKALRQGGKQRGWRILYHDGVKTRSIAFCSVTVPLDVTYTKTLEYVKMLQLRGRESEYVTPPKKKRRCNKRGEKSEYAEYRQDRIKEEIHKNAVLPNNRDPRSFISPKLSKGEQHGWCITYIHEGKKRRVQFTSDYLSLDKTYNKALEFTKKLQARDVKTHTDVDSDSSSLEEVDSSVEEEES